ncbi:MAG: hypothetical protein HY527_22965 [Betaproteobacteria bacterium]|nr:hypothetical protein [Betaproteobacteria bacterium]
MLFLDIVEYSRKPVAEQIKLRDRFNALLSDALQSVAPNDRVILDTGDGAAVSFLGDPEDALFMALTVRDSLAEAPTATDPALAMRFGINLGPVKLVKDLNGQPNIIGDGINVAQRIMSFSEPGQVLVSRSYYEVVSRLSEEYSRLFHYEGSRTDKHVREHEVYAVGVGSAVLKRPTPTYGVRGSRMHGRGTAVIRRLTETTTTLGNNLRRRPRFVTALTVVMIVSTAGVVRGNRERRDPMVAEAQRTAVQPAALTEKTIAAPVETTEAAAVPRTTSPEEKKTPTETAQATAPPASAGKKTGAADTPVLMLAISPWGEIYVDGRKRGVSPPLRNIQVAPGKHKIEIRNGEYPSHIETIDAKPGSRIRVKHKFQ